MTHWLDVVRRILSDPAEPTGGKRALILGDPARRAADLCTASGMLIVRVAVPHGVAARRFDQAADDRVVRADAGSLPFRDGSFDLVIVHATLEFTHDDRQVVGELSRVLAPGGRMVVRLPFRGRLDGIDALNLYRYTRELSGHGDIPTEALPIGWRRHYGPDDLAAIFGPSPLTIDRIEHGGLGIGELVYWPALVVSRSVLRRLDASNRLRGFYARFGDWDERLPGPATVVVTATRSAPTIWT